LDTPVSLGCWLRLKYGEARQLVEMGIRPSDYVDPLDFYRDYQAVKLLSRFPNLDTGIDTQAVALKKFCEAEVRCLETNIRLRTELPSRGVASVLYRMQRKVAHILGDVPGLEMLDFSFGPGAAFGTRGDTSVYKKISSDPECTYAFVDKLQEFLEEFPGWFPPGDTCEVRLVSGSQLTVVPKNAKTGRPICIEPLLNGLYQKGIGTYLRKRLKKFGIDLDDQGVNQKLAGQALDHGLATVDFASASDTIAYTLVMDLLPQPWFEFLDVARCPRYLCEGKWYNFHKFTSMGNAYTFELETLIFYAAATAVCEELGVSYETGVTLSVYGDDVIIPQEAFDLFQEVTEVCGFSINTEKSFREGPFFESCGHDFFLGYFVRPQLLSKEPNKLPDAFYVCNSIKRISSILEALPDPPHGGKEAVLGALRALHGWAVGCIPPRLRVVGPEGYGDGHLIGPLPQGAERHPVWDGWWFYTYVERPVQVKLDRVETPYALYFTRHPSAVTEMREYLLLKDFVKIPKPSDNGSGYGLRGRTRISKVKVLCHFVWQDSSVASCLANDPHAPL
jgi:hypothetical protein